MPLKALIFSAPSGSGKTTLVNHALQKFPNLAFSITATTRQQRGQEVHAEHYYFITEEDFKQKISAGDFVEFEEVYPGKFYGTLKSEVEKLAAAGKTVVFDVDVKGGISLKKYFGTDALSIFVLPPSVEELERRLNARNTDCDATIRTRMQKAAQEMAYQDQFDEILANTDLEQAKISLEKLLQQHLS